MRNLAICGTSPTLKNAPFDNNNWDIWYLNHLFNLVPRVTKHFDLHDTRYYDINHPYFKYLKSHEKDLYLTGIDNRLVNASLYPKDVIIKKYGDYFTCSAAWMIALAIENGYQTIGLYGIDMSTTIEQIEQKPSVLYILGIAKGLGINIVYPDGCRLFHKKKLYWS